MRWIYISPHLDDAVLSAGGLIYEQSKSGIPIEIWTMMCGYPPPGELSQFAQVLHYQWGFSSAEQVVRERRTEDVAAAGLLGAGVVHFDFLDCIYRRGKNGDWLYSDILVSPHADDTDLVDRIAENLSSRLNQDDILVCQLAVGSHIDHVLVRRGIEAISRPISYVADIPYHFDFPDELIQKTAGMKEIVHPVSGRGLNAWQEAIAAYKSQSTTLFESSEIMRNRISWYLSEGGGVRLWSFD